MKKPKRPEQSFEAFEKSSYLSGNSSDYIESIYEAYLADPSSIDQQWVHYFQDLNTPGSHEVSHQAVRDKFKVMAQHPSAIVYQGAANDKQSAVNALINAYRQYGHIMANINPLHAPNTADDRLSLSYHQLSDADLDETFDTLGVLSQPIAPLKEILSALQSIYCGTVGIEYAYISDAAEKAWCQQQIESVYPNLSLDGESKKSVLQSLTASEGLEKYLDTKYPGQKRFSIEGADSLIPLLHDLTHQAAEVGLKEMAIGMAHRGRLNVLLNIMGQSSQALFDEFDGNADFGMTTGDVKYHRGFSTDVETQSGFMHLSLMFNPSHLEFISPVAVGSVKARQLRDGAGRMHDYALPILIHGDAAFAGQGVTQETLNMSQTRAYGVGGSIHIILNNQVGFTTSNVHDARSSRYCSDPAKMIEAPIFHVNGDDPIAVIKVARLALAYRMQFHKDVVIDLVCYRRHGHQEVDEPRATQPMMYANIDQHPTTRVLFGQTLIQDKLISQKEMDQAMDAYFDQLDTGAKVTDTMDQGLSQAHAQMWAPYLEQHWANHVSTAVPKEILDSLGEKITTYPEGFTFQRNVGMIMKARQKMAAGEQAVDWGYAENLAYATLLNESFRVRLTGEDVRRGTFFHRHAAVHDAKTGQCYMPLAHLSTDQPPVQIFDSLLSETGTLGFEYGYALTDPKSLVIWEAQFGDFVNGAQVIIDQFISSGWQKWKRLSGLVMLLPHGQEGMGPEHSSARLERFLQLCAQDNIQVCVPTTPSQIFHLLRRQVLRPYRRPLVVMSPKSLLRHKLATSSLDDLANGGFQLVIPEIDDISPEKVKRVVACTGKVYYELLEKRRSENIDDIALIRVEQLYPFPYDEFSAALQTYTNAKELVWCQEEPKNQGSWFCTRDRLSKCLPDGWQLSYEGRAAMAAPAGGYASLHKEQQSALINRALCLETTDINK